jgi:hypothetical protein
MTSSILALINLP